MLRQDAPFDRTNRDYDLEEVRLFPARPTDFAVTPGNGFPVRFRVGATPSPAFEHPQMLFDTADQPFPNPGENTVTLRTPGCRARVVRVTATQLHDRGSATSFALGELQVWSGGRNSMVWFSF